MTIVTLYTGGGASLSPTDGNGRTASSYVRLIADVGKGITDGTQIVQCIDTAAPELWADCDWIEPEPPLTAEEALAILMGEEDT